MVRVTVGDLVQALLALPQDTEVWVRDNEWGLREPGAVTEDHDGASWPYWVDRRKAWDNGDETGFKVVTL